MDAVHVELQGGDRLDEPGVRERAYVDGAQRRDRTNETGDDGFGRRVVTREKDVAHDRSCQPDEMCGSRVLERGHDARPGRAPQDVHGRGALGDRRQLDPSVDEAQRVHDVDDDLAVEAVSALAEKRVQDLEGQRQEYDLGARYG